MSVKRFSIIKALVEIGIFSFITNILLLVMPLYLLQVYDRVLPAASYDTLILITVIAVTALILLSIMEVVRGVYVSRVSARLDITFSRDALLVSMGTPRSELGDIQPIRDLATVRRFIGSRGVFTFFDLPLAPLFIGVLWLIHPALFWVTGLGGLLLGFVAYINQRATAKAYSEGADQSVNAMICAQSFVRNAETLKAMGMVSNAISTWSSYQVPMLNASDDAAVLNALLAGLSRFLRMVLQVAIMGVGAWLVLSGEMTAGMIFAASIISGRGLQPIDQLTGSWPQIVETRNAWLRFKAALGSSVVKREHTKLPTPEGNLDIENLVYVVPSPGGEGVPILKRIGFRLPSGSVLGIIGPSGAGKSTLARLLVGAIKPTSGAIRLDGADLRNWDDDELGKHLGYLSQDIELFPGTIAENIARFSPERNDAMVIEAARHSQVHDLIQSLANGYDTRIGPQGLKLSGGQRQRIGLARAFYGKPRLIVLDEPNANLDGDGEIALERSIDEAKALGATVIIITQRRNIVSKFDKLLMLRDGIIEDYGPRNDVLRRFEEKQKQAAARLNAQTKSRTDSKTGNVSRINPDSTDKPARFSYSKMGMMRGAVSNSEDTGK